MIEVIPVTIRCDKKGCGATVPGMLILLAAGTLGAKPPDGHGWAFSAPRNNPTGPIMTHCPKCATTEGPRIQLLSAH